MDYRFEWDPLKAKRNLEKHGVAFSEAQTVFDDPLAGVFFDTVHSTDEQRQYIIGYSTDQHLLAVWYTDRDGVIRIISARPASAKERRGYEYERVS